MTGLTQRTARSEISDLIVAAFPAGTYNIVWNNVAEDKVPAPVAGGGTWLRVTINNDDEFQAALTDASLQRYTTVGTVVVQIFVPPGTGLRAADDAAIVAKNAFRGTRTPGGVTFENVRSREVGPSGGWFQVNVLATFTYDEVA